MQCEGWLRGRRVGLWRRQRIAGAESERTNECASAMSASRAECVQRPCCLHGLPSPCSSGNQRAMRRGGDTRHGQSRAETDTAAGGSNRSALSPLQQRRMAEGSHAHTAFDAALPAFDGVHALSSLCALSATVRPADPTATKTPTAAVGPRRPPTPLHPRAARQKSNIAGAQHTPPAPVAHRHPSAAVGCWSRWDDGRSDWADAQLGRLCSDFSRQTGREATRRLWQRSAVQCVVGGCGAGAAMQQLQSAGSCESVATRRRAQLSRSRSLLHASRTLSFRIACLARSMDWRSTLAPAIRSSTAAVTIRLALLLSCRRLAHSPIAGGRAVTLAVRGRHES